MYIIITYSLPAVKFLRELSRYSEASASSLKCVARFERVNRAVFINIDNNLLKILKPMFWDILKKILTEKLILRCETFLSTNFDSHFQFVSEIQVHSNIYIICNSNIK